MDYEQLLQVLALLNGKAGGQITGGDLSRVEDPILGLLTGTYTSQEDTGPNLNDLSYEKRPTWESLLNSEYYDENSLEMQIARSVSDGVPLMEIKKQIPQLLAASGQPAGPNDTTTQDLINFATKLDSENRDYTVAVTKANTDKNQNSWWAKAGISDPSLKADPAQILNPQLERLAQMYKPLTDPNKTGGYMGSGGRYIAGNTQPDAAREAVDKTRVQADAENAAKAFLANRPFWQQRTNEKGKQGEQAYILRKVAESTDKNLVGSNVPEDERKNRSYGEDNRERDRMIVRRDAMGGRSATNKVPVRAAKLNKEMEDRALQVAALLKERADRQAATMQTPAQSDIMNRILSLAMAERLKK